MIFAIIRQNNYEIIYPTVNTSFTNYNCYSNIELKAHLRTSVMKFVGNVEIRFILSNRLNPGSFANILSGMKFVYGLQVNKNNTMTFMIDY